MASGVFDDALIKHLWSSDEFRHIFSDANRVQKWYDFEAALALEQADLGIIPRAAANEIAAKAKIANVDVEAIAAEIRRIKHPLVVDGEGAELPPHAVAVSLPIEGEHVEVGLLFDEAPQAAATR